MGKGFDFASPMLVFYCLPPHLRSAFAWREPTFSSVQILATHIKQKDHPKGWLFVLLVAGEGLFLASLIRGRSSPLATGILSSAFRFY